MNCFKVFAQVFTPSLFGLLDLDQVVFKVRNTSTYKADSPSVYTVLEAVYCPFHLHHSVIPDGAK